VAQTQGALEDLEAVAAALVGTLLLVLLHLAVQLEDLGASSWLQQLLLSAVAALLVQQASMDQTVMTL
jgi:hypothetical protein